MHRLKRDLHRLGRIFYNLMTNKRFDDEWKIKHGVLPSFENEAFVNSTHPADVAVFEAMKMCFRYYYDGADDGRGARGVAAFLEGAYQAATNKTD